MIDDTVGKTVAAAHGRDFKGAQSLQAKSVGEAIAKAAKAAKENKTANAFSVGEFIGQKASELGIKSAVFDRRSYKFHGRVKSFVDGAKKGGLII